MCFFYLILWEIYANNVPTGKTTNIKKLRPSADLIREIQGRKADYSELSVGCQIFPVSALKLGTCFSTSDKASIF